MKSEKTHALLNERISQIEHSYEPLGVKYSEMAGSDVIDSLISHRLFSKFSDIQADPNRSQRSIESMLSYDSDGLTAFEPATMVLPQEVRHTIYNARKHLHEVLSTFRILYDSVGFPSGESYDSSKGDTSLVAKLRDVKHWKVTPDAFNFFARICYETRWLKQCAKSHMSGFTKDQNRSLWLEFGDAFCVFREKLRSVVTFWYGSRLATVPKNNDVDRVIEVECMCNMICQRTIGNSLRVHYRKVYGVDLQEAQFLHQQLIADHENATIDFSNASNSNWTALIRWFFPKALFRRLWETRAHVVSYCGEYYPLNMLAPMGNGYTFEVMTFFLTGVARYLDSHAHVFGDDVIIHRDVAEHYISTMTHLGWVVNEKKTFVAGKFRESCGAFHHEDVGYIRSFDFHWCEDDADAMVLLNKIFVLNEAYPEVPIVQKLMNIRKDILSSVPAHALRTSQITGDVRVPWYAIELNKGFFCTPSYLKRRRRTCSRTQSLYKRHKSAIMEMRRNLQDKTYDLLYIPVKYREVYRSCPKDNVQSKFWIAYYLWTGRCNPPQRGKVRVKYELSICVV
ncbi:MAG: RNA-dependent RNA polymerase [Sanya levivirus 4]|uniref:RNA-directed RNA polymerase n=1 Tax=Sanya levivirus 4 TaxID=2905512 RepID=A0A8K1XFA5_9VIRU|nr:MAG: RNA-dependent RNA polymerase [Sanya levivirus 4]